MTVEEFPAFARAHWPTIRQALLDGSYQPSPVRRVSIPKPGGRGQRPLGIPIVLDRLISQAIQQVLTPIFDPDFSESSFGFRPRRSAHGALKQVTRFLREGRRIAVDLDLAKFFDQIPHDVLLARVSRKMRDKRLLALIGRYLRAGVLVGEVIQTTEIGTPQGSPLSSLLANILLDDLEKELERRGLRFARYADDLLILVKSARAGQRVKASLTRHLTSRLKLAVNEAKSRVCPVHECVFLGFTFRGNKLRWSDEAFADFQHRVRNLLALGTSKRQAVMTAISRKSYWHLSKTLATQTGMTNQWLASQGLISVRHSWLKAHGYACGFVCSTVVNRPVRTRMPWWCGGWGLKPPGYPIRGRVSACRL